MSIEHRQSTNASELAAVPIRDVALIAASLIRDGRTAVEVVRQAYEVLEIAAYGKLYLSTTGSHEEGIAAYEDAVAAWEELTAELATIPKYEYELNDDGKQLPVPFDKGLAVLIPKPGVPKAQEADARMVRFKPFLVDWLRSDREEDERELVTKADATIEEMKRTGIPPGLFSKWLVAFPEYWQRKLSETRSAVGQKGQQAKTEEKKGKQGRVRSKDDKRLGARPPVLKLSEGDEGT